MDGKSGAYKLRRELIETVAVAQAWPPGHKTFPNTAPAPLELLSPQCAKNAYLLTQYAFMQYAAFHGRNSERMQ